MVERYHAALAKTMLRKDPEIRFRALPALGARAR